MPLCRLAVALVFLLLASQPGSVTAAAQLLQNGDFEQGSSGWSGAGLSIDGCQPYGGSRALAILSSGSAVFAQQKVPGPLGSGEYSLTGWLKVQSGSAQVEAILIWLDGDGDELSRHSASVISGPTYSRFAEIASRPAGTASLRVRLSATASAPATVCLDNISLSGPPRPSPTATATLPPPPTAIATSIPATMPILTATPKPTSTPRPTSTPSATPLPTNTALPAPAAADVTALSAEASRRDDSNEAVGPAATPALSPAAATPDAQPGIEPTPVQEVLSARRETAPPGEDAPTSLTQAPSTDDGVPAVWLIAGALFAAGLGSTYAFYRQRD